MTVLSAIALGITACAIAGFFSRRLGARRYYALMAIANGMSCISSIAAGDHLWAVIAGAWCAWCAWLWWRGGGGDGTKRRLRDAARKFTPVRRTAPQGA